MSTEDIIILHVAKNPACAGAVLIQRRTLMTGTKYLVCSQCGGRV